MVQGISQIVYSDGSQTKYLGCSFCVYVSKNSKKIVTLDEYKDIHYMEFLALLNACKICPKNALIATDSKLILQEIQNGKVKRADLKEMLAEILILMEEKTLQLKWISREKNKAGKELEKRLRNLKGYIYYSTSPKLKQRFKYR